MIENVNGYGSGGGCTGSDYISGSGSNSSADTNKQQKLSQSNHHHYHHPHPHPQLTHQSSDAALLQEIEDLKRALMEKESQLLACMQETDRQVELEDSIIAWQDKYERLYESHKRVQKVNQNLEDKLLKLVERGESKNAQLTSDVATLSVRLAQANYNISLLQREIVSTYLSTFHSLVSLSNQPPTHAHSWLTPHFPFMSRLEALLFIPVSFFLCWFCSVLSCFIQEHKAG